MSSRCTECGRIPADKNGNLDDTRKACWDCDAYTDVAARTCVLCDRTPLGIGGEPDPSRTACWDCNAHEPDYGTPSNPSRVPGVIFKASYQDSRPDKRKRILALPSSHPDAFPENANDANRKMVKNGIDPETGKWTSEEAKNKAVSEAYSRPQQEKGQ